MRKMRYVLNGRRLRQLGVDPYHVRSLLEERFASLKVDVGEQDTEVPLLEDEAVRVRRIEIERWVNRWVGQHAARARSTDPATSWEAARSISDLTERQKAVAFMFIGNPMADHELVAEYSKVMHLPYQSPSGLRTRRSELVRAGILKDSGRRTETPSGRSAIVWELAKEVRA